MRSFRRRVLWWFPAIALLMAGFPMVAQAATCPGAYRQLCQATVSPGSGTTSTTFTFSVTYQDALDRPGYWVVVRIDGVNHAMSPAGTVDLVNGTTFRYQTKLGAGAHQYRFRAGLDDGSFPPIRTDLVPLTVNAAPPPTPAPTPKPTPAPTPKPTPAPTPKPTPKPTPAPTAKATAKPTARPTPRPTTKPSAKPKPKPEAAARSTSAPKPSKKPNTSKHDPSPSASPRPTPDASTVPLVAGIAPPKGGGPRSSPMAGSAPTGGLRATGDTGPIFGMVGALVVATLGGLLLLAAARRRRDRPSPEPVAAVTASAGDLDPAPPARLVMDGDPGEADVPRWRRPSMKAARIGSPAMIAAAARRPMLLFAAPPAADVGRWVIRYDLVALLTEPDEVFGRRVADLDVGDEVESIGHRGAWLQVRTPRGDEGWLEMMTVEPYVDGQRPATALEAIDEAPVAAEAPEATEADGSGLDSLLAAIVAERARVAEAEAAAATAAAAAASVAAAPPTKRRKASATTRKRALPDAG